MTWPLHLNPSEVHSVKSVACSQIDVDTNDIEAHREHACVAALPAAAGAAAGTGQPS